MRAAYQKSKSSTERDEGPSNSQIRSLGLVGRDEESQKFLDRQK